MTWRWPWVSRELLNLSERRRVAAEDAIDGVSRQLNHALDVERRRFDDLLARYHMLKLQGATTPEPVAPREPVPPLDPIIAAINAASAGKDAKVRAGMLKQVAIDKAAELSEADIILRIQRGNRPAEEVA